jgi:ABC-type sugar transport system ATPase subunit
MIRVENLVKFYGDVCALGGVSLKSRKEKFLVYLVPMAPEKQQPIVF